MDEFQQENSKIFENLKQIIKDQVELDKMEASVTLQS